MQALTPASASDAPISFRNPRRPTGIEPLGGVLRELAVQEFLELGRFGDRLEAAPVLAAARALELGAERLDVGHS